MSAICGVRLVSAGTGLAKPVLNIPVVWPYQAHYHVTRFMTR